MKEKTLTACCLMLFNITLFAQTGQTDTVNVLQGHWVLTSIYRTPNVQGPSAAEQRRLLNTQLTYDVHHFESCGQSAPITSVQTHRVAADDFLQATHARFSNVKVTSAELTEITINGGQFGTCFGAFPLPEQDVYVKSKDELLVYFEGVFYRALRAK